MKIYISFLSIILGTFPWSASAECNGCLDKPLTIFGAFLVGVFVLNAIIIFYRLHKTKTSSFSLQEVVLGIWLALIPPLKLVGLIILFILLIAIIGLLLSLNPPYL